MRRYVLTGLMVSVLLTAGAYAVPRDERGPRDRENPVVKLVKKALRSLGDLLITPTP